MAILSEFLGVTLGVVLTALGLDLFLVPNKIAAGGVSGLATVFHYLTGAPVGMTMLALNVPLFAMGIYRLGLKFGFRSLYGTISLSLVVDALAPHLPVPTHDPLLASIFGGVLTGLGLGLVFRYRGTTGGTDLAAAILRTYTGANVGQLLFLVDGMVVLIAGFTFNSWELAMYALITIFVTAWLIDLVQEGISYTKAFFIISQKADEIAAAVLQELNRGATALKGRGMYTGMERDVLLVVVNRSEVTRLKDLIYKVDREAFVILADVHEVLGEGFKQWRES
ncbi:YitT family protein [Desulfofundulus salinus]|uniref:YitT family protein n=1 Tax=Desulfofundulus salinus TaxID=2419843 RepID=A0A494WY44_9FIRM|nr:YitT family protein [Desulfofundulus salinum]RKO65797.1 YitT family protein [Desulfofundulus salinum]